MAELVGTINPKNDHIEYCLYKGNVEYGAFKYLLTEPQRKAMPLESAGYLGLMVDFIQKALEALEEWYANAPKRPKDYLTNPAIDEYIRNLERTLLEWSTLTIVRSVAAEIYAYSGQVCFTEAQAKQIEQYMIGYIVLPGKHGMVLLGDGPEADEVAPVEEPPAPSHEMPWDWLPGDFMED
jgi:hypothetical protein